MKLFTHTFQEPGNNAFWRIIFAGLFVCLVSTSCHDEVYNEETNRIAVQKRKKERDSLRQVEQRKKDSLDLQDTLK